MAKVRTYRLVYVWGVLKADTGQEGMRAALLSCGHWSPDWYGEYRVKQQIFCANCPAGLEDE